MDITSQEQTLILAGVKKILDALPGRSGRQPSRQEAVALMFAHTRTPGLRAHMLAVEASMAAMAARAGVEDDLPWRLAGLLHDFDYEAHPTPVEHPLVGCGILLEEGYSAEIIEAILGHATYSGVVRRSPMARALFAVDELTGFLSAMAYVRPEGLAGLKYRSFKKKFKTSNFAASVLRQDIELGADELGVSLSELVLYVAQALHERFPHFPRVPEAGN